jgi:hypothetical protein
MDVSCSSPVCQTILNAACVRYEGGQLPYIGILSNENLKEALKKIEEAYKHLVFEQVTTLYITFNTQTEDYILQESDQYNIQIRMDSGSPLNLTIMNHGVVPFPTGTRIMVKRIGDGVLTFVEGSPLVTITPSGGDLQDAGKNVLMALIKTGINSWDLENGVSS